MLTVLPKKLGHNLAWTQPQSEGKMLYQQNTVGKEIAASPPELDRILKWKYLQYEGKTCRGMEPRPRIAVVVVTHNTERNSLTGCHRDHNDLIV